MMHSLSKLYKGAWPVITSEIKLPRKMTMFKNKPSTQQSRGFFQTLLQVSLYQLDPQGSLETRSVTLNLTPYALYPLCPFSKMKTY